jgi:hypothetical protein
MLWVFPNNSLHLILFPDKPLGQYFREYLFCSEFPHLQLPSSLLSFFGNIFLNIDSYDFPVGISRPVASINEALAFARGPYCSYSLLACQASY